MATAQPADQQFFARLAELNEKFAARLPTTLARLDELSQALAGAGRPDVDVAPAAGELQAMLHTLAGSAATFGFRGLGHHARLLEQRLRVLRAFDVVAATEWQAWRAELDEYIRAAQLDPKALS
ncbi:Hpt domain-containing protein [Telluria beijingensis]|uniref:Hpt domain-containing protein n=1 Tax=Telluria beijingensis TaxID=3068633 RepID=UPI0027953843|nr:Hpt domain-containing protein [Massilia sp. REN29]